MEALPQAHPITSDLSGRTMTLNLVLKAPGHVLMRSCEILGRGFRNRVSFQENQPIEEVLVGRLSHEIHKSLKTVPDGAHVLSQPEFLVELPGLALYGIHILVMEAKDGIRNAILRFKEFIGAANLAFVEDMGFHEPAATHSEKLAMNVLEDICLPILNLCETFESLARANGQAVPATVSDRAREFQFQTELLKRFIFNSNIGHADAPQDYLKASQTLKQLRLQQ